MLAQVLSYAPFIGAQVLAKPSQRAAVADFVGRTLPLADPDPVVPSGASGVVAEALDTRERRPRRRVPNGVRQLVLIVVGIGVLGVVVGGTIGPFAGRILFGHKFNLGNADVALLAVGQRPVHPGARAVAGA